MPTEYEKLVQRVHEINDLNKASALMMWDREVNMPRAGSAERIAQITTLSSLIHRMATSDELGELIENAAAELDGADYDSNEASLIRLLRRDYADARKLPDHRLSAANRAKPGSKRAPRMISRTFDRGLSRWLGFARNRPNTMATKMKNMPPCWTSTKLR
jgi:Zn-dependent M32 family carboxypeptidase